MLFKLLSFVSLLAVTAVALPSPQAACLTCASTDLAGDALVAKSGGTRGTPQFCGYSADATGASGPQVTCFYGSGGGVFSSSSPACPPTLVAC